MDSITQLALGAAVGEAVLGRRIGRKAALWGALLGTFPDIDIVLAMGMDPMSGLAIHRAMTHSIPVVLLLSVVSGFGLSRLYRKERLAREQWIYFAFWIFTAHILLDLFTVYGAQIFWPILDIHVSFDSIFVVDPFFTIPLVTGILMAVIARRNTAFRWSANIAGLLFCSLYLTWAAGAKMVMHASFMQSFYSKGIVVDRLLTTPTPLNTILWTGIGQKGDSLHISQLSVLKPGLPITLTNVSRNTHLLAGHLSDPAVEQLLKHTKEWYSITENEDDLIVSDYRSGIGDSWLGSRGKPIFRYRLNYDGQEYTSFEPLPLINDYRDVQETLAAVYLRAISE